MVEWAWWVVLGGVGCCSSLRGDVLHLRYPASPLCGRVFPVFIAFGIGRVGLLSPKKKEKKDIHVVHHATELWKRK